MSEQKTKHIYIIDYLKAVSIIMVIITHYNWQDKTTPFFTLLIAMAVPIFMLLTSYNFTMSFERRTSGKIGELYDGATLLPRLVRFVVPYALIYVAEVILWRSRGKVYTVKELFLNFAEGGFGPGSYYFPILIQLLFVFPLLYLLIRKFSWKGVIAVAALNFGYELLVKLSGMPKTTYRLLLFRYLLYLGFGCYMFFHLREEHNKEGERKYPMKRWVLAALFAFGLWFLLYMYYPGYHASSMHIMRYWTKTAMPVACYIFPLIFLLMKYGQNWKMRGLHVFFSEIGKASYHIFLVQMLYFKFFDDIMFPATPAVPVALGNVAVSLLLGYGYYRVENFYISGKLLPLVKKDTTGQTVKRRVV